MSFPPLCLKLTKNAQHNLQDILTYTYEEWGRAQAEKYKNLIFQKLTLLCTKPNLGRQKTTQNGTDYWSYKIGSHIVIYHISDADLWVTNLFHERMDIPSHIDHPNN